LQINNEFRYLFPGSAGQARLEYLPEDEEAGDLTRRYVNLQHETAFGEGWQIVSGLEEVSDPAYFEDLGGSLSVTSQTHLNRFLDVAYFAPYWSVTSRLQNYQTIDTLIVEEDLPYERLPQVLFEGFWAGDLLGFESTNELVNFERDVGDTGWRLDSTQEVSVRFGRPGMWLTPALALRQTNYWLDRSDAAADESPSRTLPVASIDTGLSFERPAGRGARFVQTLEPRLLYVHVPFEDQSELPVFDTLVPDFNLVQLFRKYQFVGADRVTDADQLSFGVTTRLIDGQTGQERLSATLGQTRYLSTQAVSLPGELPNDAHASDYIAEFSVGLHRSWNMDVGYQWNSITNSTARAETRFEFRPQQDRLFGFGYRYREGLLEQGDLSLVWPAAARWRVIGRYSYSFLEDKPLEQFLGLEFEACCWRLRLVGRNFISRRTGESDNSILFQLELKGLSQGGRSPEELLDRGILGYRPTAVAPIP
jgi:LPS-assembly protein